MKNKLKVFSVLVLMSMWLTACDNENIVSDQQQTPKNTKEIYTRSDLDDEAWVKLNAAYERGRARYDAAQKKLQQKDSVERAQRARAAKTNGGAER